MLLHSENHEDLARVLNDVAGRHWILTYDNAPQVAELYSERRRQELRLNYSAHRVVEGDRGGHSVDTIPEIGEGWPIVAK